MTNRFDSPKYKNRKVMFVCSLTFLLYTLLLNLHEGVHAADADDESEIDVLEIVNEDGDLLSGSFVQSPHKNFVEDYKGPISAKSKIIVPNAATKLAPSNHTAHIREMAIGYKPNQRQYNSTMKDHHSSLVSLTTRNISTSNSSSELTNALQKLQPSDLNNTASNILPGNQTNLLNSTQKPENKTFIALTNNNRTTLEGHHHLTGQALNRNNTRRNDSLTARTVNLAANNQSNANDTVHSGTSQGKGNLATSAPVIASKKNPEANVITDAGVKGFLAKNDNFTISNVSSKKPSNKTETKEDDSKKSAEEKAKKKSLSNVVQNVSGDPFDGQLMEKTGTEIKTFGTKIEDRSAKLVKTVIVPDKLKLSKKELIHLMPTSGLGKLHVINPDEFIKKSNLNRNKSIIGYGDENPVKKGSVDHDYDHDFHHYECGENKTCPKGKYCDHHHCFDCHRLHHECVEDDQCCDDRPCVYGRCDDKKKGSPGTICDKDKDCGDDGCCVLEPTISEHHGICKKRLQEYHQCSPVLFRKVWIGDERPKCGPCAKGLECKERGVIASHLVCVKAKKS